MRYFDDFLCYAAGVLAKRLGGNEYPGPDVNGIVFRKRPSLHLGRIKYD